MSIEVDPETNPLLTGDDNIGYDETGEQIEMKNLNMYDSSSRRGSVDPTSSNRTQDETSFGGGKSTQEKNEIVQLLRREYKNIDDAWEIIKSKFPNANTDGSSFTATLDEFGRVMLRLNRIDGKYHPLFKSNGKLNDKLPKKIIDSLGKQAEDIVEINEEEIARHSKKICELQDQLEKTSDEHMRDNINQAIAEEQDMIAQLERANEEIEQRMTLRDRVKAIFRKYGFTVLAVTSAVGVVIGVNVANLKNGLTSLSKGVGNGLKTIGKKLGEILPGLVAAIASFVFRTAGEVVGFLAENAWLLIAGVVIYLVEQFKKKK